MGTIADKLNLLLNTKAAIKAAIIGKGQTVADSDLFSTYPAKIQAIETGIQLPTLTNPGTAADLLTGKQLIDADGNPLTGTMPEVEQATPSISVSSAGLITASATQAAGYVAAGTKSATKQLTTKAAETITPSTADQTIAAGTYLTGAQTIKGDANLLAENIKSGVSIFGVSGALSNQELYFTTGILTSLSKSGSICTAVIDCNSGATVLDSTSSWYFYGGGGTCLESTDICWYVNGQTLSVTFRDGSNSYTTGRMLYLNSIDADAQTVTFTATVGSSAVVPTFSGSTGSKGGVIFAPTQLV